MAVRQLYRGLLNSTELLTLRSLAPDSRLDERLMREKLSFANDLYQQDLKGHFGCVNAIEFSNGEGDILASGGDDRRVMLWNVIGALAGSTSPVHMKGEHNSNIFCLSFDAHNKKIFSGGNDDQVIMHDIETGVDHSTLAPVYDIDMSPVKVGEQNWMDTQFKACGQKYIKACQEADGLFAFGPMVAAQRRLSSLFFQDLTLCQLSHSPYRSGQTLDVFMHDDVVYGLSADPVNEHVFASGCDGGRILVFDVREPPNTDAFCLASITSSMYSVMHNPMDPHLIASANAKEGIGLWDIRRPRMCLIRYNGQYTQQSFMSVRINRFGDKIIGLRRRFPPVMFHINNSKPLCEFDQTGYYNSCTMKSCSFAGDRDQYLLSGSDDFNLYMWRIPDDLTESTVVNHAQLVLKGHRSIVNQVRFNPASHLICSSGVEKVVKIWSPFPLPNSQYVIDLNRTSERPVYTHEEYINLVLYNGHVMSHDYSHQSKDEDPRMMAFFDSLVQRELDRWSSEEELSSNDEDIYDRIMQLSRSDVSDSDSHGGNVSLGIDSSDDDDTSFRSFTLAFASVMAARTAARSAAGFRLLNPEENIDPENVENSTNPNTEILEGQSPNNTNRRSISQLILQKKKEIEKIVSELKIEKKKHKKTIVTSSDESSDDDTQKMQSLAKRSGRKMLKSTASSTQNSSSHTSIDPAQKQKTNEKLKRLKQLRARITKSDSEASDVEPLPLSLNDDNQCTEVPNSAELAKFTCLPSECKKSRDKTELGPYLYEADFSVPSSSGHVDKKPCTTNLVEEECSNIDSKTSISDLNRKTDFTIDHPAIPDATASTSNTDTENNNIPNASANQDTVTDPQPVWTEFKRFKHQLERARRYRRHSQTEHDSNDDN